MATLPSALALTTIADGSPIIAADPRNNFTAIQTEANALLTILGSGVTGQFFTGNGTTVSMSYPPGFEFNYKEFPSTVNVLATTAAGATTVVTADPVTFDGATTVWVEFYSDVVIPPGVAGQQVNLDLWQDSTDLGIMSQVLSNAAVQLGVAVRVGRRVTPSNASHTFSVRAWASSTSGTPSVGSGAGGAGTPLPGYIRITKA